MVRFGQIIGCPTEYGIDSPGLKYIEIEVLHKEYTVNSLIGVIAFTFLYLWIHVVHYPDVFKAVIVHVYTASP
jgi:hypothetical protein